MAEAMEIAPNEGMHALPPTRHVAPIVHVPGKGDCLNWILASAGIATTATATRQPSKRFFQGTVRGVRYITMLF